MPPHSNLRFRRLFEYYFSKPQLFILVIVTISNDFIVKRHINKFIITFFKIRHPLPWISLYVFIIIFCNFIDQWVITMWADRMMSHLKIAYILCIHLSYIISKKWYSMFNYNDLGSYMARLNTSDSFILLIFYHFLK